MKPKISNLDESRLPELDDDGRVRHDQCSVVSASIMLPVGATAADVRALMERLFDREPTVLHWSTNWFEKP